MATILRSPKFRRIVGNGSANVKVEGDLDVTGTVTANAVVDGAGAVHLQSTLVVDGAVTLTGALTHKPNVVSGSGASVSVSVAQSGSVLLFDRAAGIVFTLPTPAVGLQYDFMVLTTITSGAAKVITDAGTTLLTGSIINTDSDSSNAVASWLGNGSSHIAVSMNGTTTGGIKGDWLRFTCISSTLWLVTGMTTGTSTVATPFATS